MKKIVAILLICAAALYAAPPFFLEQVIPKKYRLTMDSVKTEIKVADYLQLQRNFEKLERKLREMDAFRDSTFIQSGSLASGQFSWQITGTKWGAIVYLPFKYASTNSYRVVVGRTSPVIEVASHCILQRWSDSSFVIQSDTTGNGIDWMTIGIRKK